jgi:Gram-negative bacterial TonB protein C-terminal
MLIRRLVPLLLIATFVGAENKGSCPMSPAPPARVPEVSPPAPPKPDLTYAGTVSIHAVLSDKGYVCSTRVLAGIDKEIDKASEEAIRQWHFEPTMKDGKAVSAAVLVQVFYWFDKDGKLVSNQLPHSKDAQDSPSPAQP